MSLQPESDQNALLASLPPAVLRQLSPKLKHVDLPLRKVLYEPGEAIDAAYFPSLGMISLVANLEDGARAEVGIIGREGVLGISLMSEMNTSYVEAMVQLSGAAMRMEARDFRHEFGANAAFRAVLLRYSDALNTQIIQTAACNGRHGLEQRLARWLLMAQDRAQDDELPLTQDFLATMLGVHRPSITVTAGILQRAGLIRYSSGRVTVLDRASLEQASCECYEAIRRRAAGIGS